MLDRIATMKRLTLFLLVYGTSVAIMAYLVYLGIEFGMDYTGRTR